jgi:hypothetical protein
MTVIVAAMSRNDDTPRNHSRNARTSGPSLSGFLARPGKSLSVKDFEGNSMNLSDVCVTEGKEAIIIRPECCSTCPDRGSRPVNRRHLQFTAVFDQGQVADPRQCSSDGLRIG